MTRSLPLETTRNTSFDGYVRMTFDAFMQLTFPHKLAWEDSELNCELRAESFPACRAGYCEWDTCESVAVSVGWAWFAIADGTVFVAPGYVNSNLMFVTQNRFDLGPLKTSELLRAWLSSLQWRPGDALEQQDAVLPPYALPTA